MSSRPITIRVCATEDVFAEEPQTEELGRWSGLRDGSRFTVRVPRDVSGLLKVSWPDGDQSLSLGKSTRSLAFVSKAEVPDSHADYVYEVRR